MCRVPIVSSQNRPIRRKRGATTPREPDQMCRRRSLRSSYRKTCLVRGGAPAGGPAAPPSAARDGPRLRTPPAAGGPPGKGRDGVSPTGGTRSGRGAAAWRTTAPSQGETRCGPVRRSGVDARLAGIRSRRRGCPGDPFRGTPFGGGRPVRSKECRIPVLPPVCVPCWQASGPPVTPVAELSGIGFTVELPNGMSIDSAAGTTCAGADVDAAQGYTTITVSGAELASNATRAGSPSRSPPVSPAPTRSTTTRSATRAAASTPTSRSTR